MIKILVQCFIIVIVYRFLLNNYLSMLAILLDCLNLFSFVVQPLRMVFGVTNKTVEHVSSTTLSCFARGFPFPSYTWTKDGSSVIPNGVLSEQNTVLQLSRVTMASEGWYTCTATTSLGSANSSAYLAVHGA